MTNNERAFLDMIAFSEGTDNGRQKTACRGYDVMVGGQTFEDFTDHPHKVVRLSDHLASSAAGRYQILSRYWDIYKSQLGLKDFSPESQDAVAMQILKECHALDDINEGRFEDAVKKCAHIWASLPGAGYGQHENRMDSLKVAYVLAGGTFAYSA